MLLTPRDKIHRLYIPGRIREIKKQVTDFLNNGLLQNSIHLIQLPFSLLAKQTVVSVCVLTTAN
jgi:hypothetical protein